MPTERFYHLPEEKKSIIRSAAVEEFARVPYEKASINKIIQSAGISRGSFYTYFEDKRDVLSYIFSDSAEKLNLLWQELMEKNNGNLWQTAEDLLDQLIDHINKQEKKETMFHMMQNMVLFEDLEKTLDLSIHEICPHEITKDNKMLLSMYEATDKACFRDDSLYTFWEVLDVILSALASSMGRYYHHLESQENIKKIFRDKLEILQYGICKR